MAVPSSEIASPVAVHAGGLRVAVRLTPKASRNGVNGIAADADGGARIKVSVTAPPESGKANAALIKLLSRQWKLPKSDISIIRGLTGRRKTVLVSGDPQELAARLAPWLDKLAADRPKPRNMKETA
ncbi:MAG: DUF167 domain-containing protein [Rhodospirillales bacterium]|jgi:hypothetical protein|nr:hypothetical protein [Rhodospirillaceae bacterium]MDP6426443.1 DUF167 domain-containing protein [Rhodospirillales bacterium]MDP6643303.1 DUF167 domain-containing protein [Rhodospirillales bacterium]|tara:strand:- start:223 stop:603 length:381 start_codon:yes stop_codon:yes gene_type:complete